MRILQSFAIAVLLAALGPSAAAQEQPPAPAEPKPFELPQATRFTLANGMGVTLVPYGSLPQLVAQVTLRVGNLNEGERTWLADLTGELLKEGTLQRDGQALAAGAAAMGGSLTVGVGADQTTVNGTALSQFAPDLIALLAEVVREPAFPDDAFARIQGDLQRRVAVARTQPQSLALEAFRKALYGDHPYGRYLPTDAQLAAYTVDDARRFYAENAGAARAHLYVAGRFDAPALERAIRNAFEGWAAGPAPFTAPPETTPKRALVELDRPGAPQSTLYLGLPVIDPSHPDRMALSVANAMLGGYFSSRITSNIREDKGYTYSPFSQLSSRYRDAYWVQVADVTTAHTADSLREIFHEIERLRSEPAGDAELAAVKSYLGGTFVLQNSAPGAIIGQLAYIDLHGLPDDYLETYVLRLSEVTAADVQRVAQKYLDPEAMTLVVVGDPAALAEQLPTLDWVRSASR